MDIQNDIKKLFQHDMSGHGFDHTKRVYQNALLIAQTEPEADKNIIALAALLHDVDDYKLFGAENAQNLTNARQLMQTHAVDNHTQSRVLEIIQTMGYANALKGIRPTTREGQIVSDADMLDAIGALGIVRTLAFSFATGRPVFDATAFPETDETTYTDRTRKTNTGINHFFEKLLKIRGLLLTDSAKKLAAARHKIMFDFLNQFFDEQGLDDWKNYLRSFK